METRQVLSRISLSVKVVSEIDEEIQQKFALASGKKFELDTFDISKSGIGILSKVFLPNKLVLDLEICPDPFGLEKAIKVKGEIRYCKYVKTLKYTGYKCGVKFLNISDAHKKAIAQFISTHDRRKDPRVNFTDQKEPPASIDVKSKLLKK